MIEFFLLASLCNAVVSSWQFLSYGAGGFREDYDVGRHLWYGLRACFDWGLAALVLSLGF